MRSTLSVLALFVFVVACQQDRRPLPVEFRIAERTPGDSLVQMVLSGWGNEDTFFVHQNTELSGDAITSAEVTHMNEHPAIAVEFSAEGAEILARLTGSNVDRHLAMIIDGVLVSAPLIRAKIDGGRAIINGDFTSENASEIADRLTIH